MPSACPMNAQVENIKGVLVVAPQHRVPSSNIPKKENCNDERDFDSACSDFGNFNPTHWTSPVGNPKGQTKAKDRICSKEGAESEGSRLRNGNRRQVGGRQSHL